MPVTKRFFSILAIFSTLLWLIGIGVFMPQQAQAAITASGPFDLIPSGGMYPPANGFDMPLIRFALNQSAGETLSSVAVTIVNNTGGAVTNNVLADHIKELRVWRDANNNNFFDPESDTVAGTLAVVKVATSTSVISTTANNSLAASGNLPTSFFVTISTDAAWAVPDSFMVNLAADGIVTSANSPTVTALTGSKAISAMGEGSWGGFSISEVEYINATTLDITFTENLDLNSGATTSTSNYTLSTAAIGDTQTITSVMVLSNNRSVRVSASGAQIVSAGTDTIAVSNAVRNTMGMANANTSPNIIYSGIKPFVISEIKVGSASDEYDEFIELYNRSSGAVSVSANSLKLHIVNAAGTVDVNLPLTFLSTVSQVAANKFLLIAPITSPASSTADAVYTTSSLASLIPNGAVYISNSTASSTAVLDKVCWGSHSNTSDCEGSAASAALNNGQSIERKAFNSSSSDTMAVGGTDALQGHNVDTQNNNYDFVARATPLPQNSSGATEVPSGGFYGSGNQQPEIQHTTVFRANSASSLNLITRISDDSGPLSAANTQLIFCTTDTTCTPASSTPIYGVSIGSGWYKFSSTSTSWSNGKTYFRYYLQAADSSPAPYTKSRVFTSDPNYDSVTYQPTWSGIQTAADQASKAITISLESGNLGSAFINGTVQDSSGAAVSGATVWIDGTQFAATTGSDGTFSFANVGPSGGVQIRIANEGYTDQAISKYIPASGLVSLGTITLYAGEMGQGGDYDLPQVVSSFPQPNMMSFPTQSPSGNPPSIEITFNKEMNTTTFVTSTADSASSNMYLTEAGSQTRIAGAVTAVSATQARFTPTANLTVGRGYNFFITPGVKDTAGNPITGNGPGGSYVLMFSTAGQMFESGGPVSGFGTGNAFPPFVVGGQPAPGKTNVARNSKVFVTFSESLQNTANNLSYVVLYRVTGAYTGSESKTLVSTSRTLDSSQKIVILTPSETLSSSVDYRLEVTGGITSSKGISLGNPSQTGYTSAVMYKSDFQTGSSSDSTAPTVSGTIPGASATGASTIKPIIISFSEAMDPSTITESSVSLKLGSSAVAGDLSYDSTNRTATFVSDYALSPTSTYTISVTTAVSDLASQTLDQDSDTAGNQGLLRTFTTGSSDTSSPTVVSAQASDFALKINYSKPMLAVTASDSDYANSVLNSANYTVRRVSAAGATEAAVTLPSTATITYDSASRAVAINGLPTMSGFEAGTTLLNIVVSNVKDIGYNSLAATANAATTTAQSSAKTGGFFFGGGGGGMGPMMDAGGNIMQGGMMGGPPPMVGTFVDSGIGFAPGVKVFPFNKMAGASTIYGIEIPISYQIPNAGFIEITFPEGTDVSQAKKDLNSPPNSDLNGPGPGTVVFGTTEGTLPSGFATGGQSNDGVIVDATSRKVRVILGAVATRRGTGNLTTGDGDQHDFMRLDIAQVINSTISTGIDTAGSSATVETKKSDGTILETLSSTSFFTSAAGSFTVRGHATTTASGINGVNVFLMSPMTGPQSTTTANNLYGGTDGEFQFQNLVAGTYMLGVEQYFKVGGTSYTSSFPAPITVGTANCPSDICSRDIIVTDASTGVAVTLSISGTFSDDAVDIFASGPGTFRKATSTLNGTLTNNTDNSIKLNSDGIWMVGFGPQMSTEIFGKGSTIAPPSWMIPRQQQVVISGCPSACAANPSTLSFNVSAANKTVKFIVRDASGAALANAHVFAYSPGGGFGADTQVNADGTGSLGLGYGTYKIGAGVSGMPAGQERTILVKDDGGTDKVFIDGSTTGIALSAMTNANLVLLISKPSYTISGKVTDGTNQAANVPVNAYRTDGPGHADTFTNSSGEYTLYVNSGIWKVQALLPDYGKLSEKTITITTASVSGQNFEPNTSAVNYGTITPNIGNDANSDGVLNAGEGAANVQVIVEGTTGDFNGDGDTSDSGENQTYFNTAITDSNGSSTLKLPPGAYTMKAWSPVQGEMSSSTQNIVVNNAGTVTTALYDVVAPQTGTVTINILDSNGAPTTTAKAAIEFMQIGGKTNKAESASNVVSSTLSLPIYDVANALNAVTSTNPTNMYLMQVNIPGVSVNDLIVYGSDNNTILATSTATAGYWKVEVDGNENISVKLPAVKFVNGTVKDGDDNAVPGATVHIENKTTGETIDVQADSSGNYNAKLSSGTYLVQADKDGYVDTASTVTVSDHGAIADSATTMAAANQTITGTVQINGTATSGATARAEKLGGGVVTASTGSDGTYTLNVTAGDWKVSAVADGYNSTAYGSVASAGASGININLTSSKSNLAGAFSLSLTPQTGGSLSDSTASTSIKANNSALADSANAYTMNEKETSNVVGGGSGTPISGEAKTVSSYDYNGNAVTLLNKDVAVSIDYSNSEMASSLGTLTVAKLQNVKMGSFDGTADNWENLPTTIGYKDSNGKFIEPSISASTVAYTGMTSHFSVFNPIVPSDGLAPSAPTNVAASAGSATVTITWTAPTTNADSSALSDLLGYEIYRSTSSNGTYTQINSSDITGASYTDSTVSNGVNYYYKVTAADTGGLESAMSAVSNVALPQASTTGSGGGGVISQPSPTLGATPIAVEGGNTVSSRTIVLKFNAQNAVQMAVSEKSDFSDTSWESYLSSKNFTLSSGVGKKTVYAKFRTSLGGVSEVKSVEVNMTAEGQAAAATEQVACELTIGQAYKASDSPAVYYITDECKKRPFHNPKVFFTYFTAWKDVLTTTKATLQSITNDNLGFMPWGPKYDPKYGALVKIVTDPKVYLLLGTEKYWITSPDVFNSLNYNWKWIEDIDQALLDKYATGSEISATDKHPNYTIVKYAKSAKVYRLEPAAGDSSKQVRRHIKNEAAFNALNFRWDRIVTISDSEVYDDGSQLTAPVSAGSFSATPADAKFTKNLTLGSSGNEVKELQLKLKGLGYFTYSTATGYYGSVTAEAVKKFQVANGLSAMGKVDGPTRELLNQE